MSKGEAKKACITDGSKSAEEDQQRSPKGGKIIYSRLSELRLLHFHPGDLSINVFVLF